MITKVSRPSSTLWMIGFLLAFELGETEELFQGLPW
jgi:hypothetical protein